MVRHPPVWSSPPPSVWAANAGHCHASQHSGLALLGRSSRCAGAEQRTIARKLKSSTPCCGTCLPSTRTRFTSSTLFSTFCSGGRRASMARWLNATTRCAHARAWHEHERLPDSWVWISSTNCCCLCRKILIDTLSMQKQGYLEHVAKVPRVFTPCILCLHVAVCVKAGEKSPERSGQAWLFFLICLQADPSFVM